VRDHLVQMEDTWDSLADDHEKQLERLDRLKQLDAKTSFHWAGWASD
jgi:hypothetical protein